jgi:hypothetical protein
MGDGAVTKYRVVKAAAPDSIAIVVAQGQPANGFETAVEAEVWMVANELDWRWYIAPITDGDL